MKWTFVVHNVSAQTRHGVAPVNGTPLSVIIPEVEVELTDPLGQQGSLQLHFRTPEEQEYALAAYKPGESIELEIGPSTLASAPSQEAA